MNKVIITATCVASVLGYGKSQPKRPKKENKPCVNVIIDVREDFEIREGKVECA